MRKSVCVAAAAWILFSGCGGRKRVALPSTARIGSTETAVASWYGHPYHGRRAANGEIYDMEKMTAAHRTLPFDTWVRVRNLANNKTVDVRITDRGPFVGGRIVDLSHAAALAIDLIGPGTAKVKLTVIAAKMVSANGAVGSPVHTVSAGEPSAPPASPSLFAVQVGAFADKRNAERVRASMERTYGS